MNSTNVHMKLFAYCNLHLDYLTNIWKCLKLVIALFILALFFDWLVFWQSGILYANDYSSSDIFINSQPKYNACK